MNFQREKRIVRAYHAALDAKDWSAAAQHIAPECRWRGYHPFNEMVGPDAPMERFWQPLHDSIQHLQRREDAFFAGLNEMDGFTSTWVVSMGHLVGLFDAPWLGIPATGRMVFLRYATFLKADGAQITDIAMFFDIPQVMVQAGLTPMPSQLGAELVQPGPHPHDALLFEPQPEEAGKATLDAINAMIGDLGNWDLGLPLEEELRRTWHEDMIWWGPTGIGATYTIPRYARQHSGPFRRVFSDRNFIGHIARLAEGQYGGFFGWPNFTARLTEDYMGLPTAGQVGEFRVIDIYRRAGDKLAENWVFIDVPHFWLSQGVQILPDEASALT
ncbi:MAG: nuclear transport factor 2 family protein [Pseudomonadota bacterium]